MGNNNAITDGTAGQQTQAAPPPDPLAVLQMYVNRITPESVKLFAVPENAELLIVTDQGGLRSALTEGTRVELRLLLVTE